LNLKGYTDFLFRTRAINMSTQLGLSDKARVLHAALSLPAFTVVQLAEFAGVKTTTAQTTVNRSREFLEQIGQEPSERRGGRAYVYRLRESAREQLAREVMDLAEKLSGTPARNIEAAVKRVEDALAAVASSIEFARDPQETDETSEVWHERAAHQMEFSQELIDSLPESQRASWGARLSDLRRRLTFSSSTEQSRSWIECWQRLWSTLQEHAASVSETRLTQPVSRAGRETAPAAVFCTADQNLPQRIAQELQAAYRLTLQANLRDVTNELREQAFREYLLQTLRRSPKDTSLIVTLDSSDARSRSSVSEFLNEMHTFLWEKQHRPPAVFPELTFVDRSVDASLMQTNLRVLNLNYLPNICNAQSLNCLVEALVAGDAAQRVG
jgi:hypothetical protein